ncbi:PEP-CTERM sorting domain-containing protein [Mariniblastus fucicola]|uniref:PEP-CTERM protein-sorting domain-containing protein n=1 Tax=Mariniblastus fucicola TaxID=980251 RepID=A0A5B9PC42_9BACT|nr:PEP-CTERM sorting domain-containing protein [Mariniblastus fucicola]QEG24297.1 hypothetical protein MFFC18_42150 [Mariniblastus fucicola]
MSVCMRAAAIFVLSVSVLSSSAFADEIGYFAGSAEASDGDFGWDVFSGAWSDTHQSQFASGIGTAELVIGGGAPTMPPGGVTETGDIYTHDASNPTFDFTLTGLDSSEAFTSVVLQFATTQTTLDASAFELGGAAPDEFISLGQDGSVPFGQTSFPYNFYWAEWIGVDSATTLNASIDIGSFRVIGGAKATYYNTDSALNVTNVSAVPEPSAGVLSILVALFAVRRRRD